MIAISQVKVLVAEGVIGAASNFTIASQDKDLDQKFEDALALLRLDLEDKSTVALSWQSMFYRGLSLRSSVDQPHGL